MKKLTAEKCQDVMGCESCGGMHRHNNPLRAAMIVFLMMNEGE